MKFSLEYEVFKCDVSHNKCFYNHNIKHHIASAHEKKKPLKCNLCNSIFNEKGSLLEKHIALVHEENKPFQCDICAKF